MFLLTYCVQHEYLSITQIYLTDQDYPPCKIVPIHFPIHHTHFKRFFRSIPCLHVLGKKETTSLKKNGFFETRMYLCNL